MLERMVIQKRSFNLFALLECYAGVAPSEIPILSRPSNLPKRREKRIRSKARILWKRGRSQVSHPISMLKKLKLLGSIERRVPSRV